VAALAAVGVAFALVVGTYGWLAGTGTRAGASAEARSATTVGVPPEVQPAPVDLVSMAYRATRADFVVTGQIRNPAAGTPLHDVVVILQVVDQTGRVLKTVQAPLTPQELNAGEEAAFSVTASKVTKVARYRVTFQDARRVAIPHVDRRQKAVTSHV
jgi:hypothetical protein